MCHRHTGHGRPQAGSMALGHGFRCTESELGMFLSRSATDALGRPRSNRAVCPDSTSAGRGNLLHCVTGTYQVLTLYSEIHAQVPLSRLEAFHDLCADGTFIGGDLCHQAFGPFDAKDVVFSSNPGCISVSCPSLPA